MARLAFCAALMMTVVVIVGCDPAKELPSDVPKSTAPTEKVEQVPAASEPAAKAFVEKAVKAYTGGKPELVAKGKSSRLMLKGKVVWPGDNTKTPVEATRTIAAVWSDRVHCSDDLQGQGRRLAIEVWLHRPHINVLFGGVEQNQFNPTELERNFATDEIAQRWMAFYLPLTDPKAIVYDLKSQIGGTQPGQPPQVQLLKLSLGDFPVYHLTFDANTHALLRVEHAVTERGHPIKRTWTMSEHKVGPEGLLLPNKMECRWNDEVKEEWVVEKWEFPDKIPDEEFAPPRK